MKKQLIILLFFLPFITYSQIDFQNPPWEIGCDSAQTQTDMNICSYHSYLIADSIFTQTYRSFIEALDAEYKQESAIKSEDSKSQKEYLKLIRKQKKLLISSHKHFLSQRKNITDIIGLQYEGGSIQHLIMNMYALDLTVNQLKTYTSIMEEILER